MNITHSNGTPPDNSLQVANIKQTQAVSEIAASKHKKPLQVNATTEASIDRQVSERRGAAIQLSQQPTDIPAEVPLNIPMCASLARSLANELSEFPDIDHAKVAEVMKQLSNTLTVDTDDLASAMMAFYQGGR